MKAKDLSILLELAKQQTQRLQIERAVLIQSIEAEYQKITTLNQQVFSAPTGTDFQEIARFNQYSIKKIQHIQLIIQQKQAQLVPLEEAFEEAIRDEKKLEILRDKLQKERILKIQKSQEELLDFISLSRHKPIRSWADK